MIIVNYHRFMEWKKRAELKIRYWVIKKLVGGMPVVANINISNYDVECNFGNIRKMRPNMLMRPHMLFNNSIYNLEERIKETVYSGRDGDVVRHGNTFVFHPKRRT